MVSMVTLLNAFLATALIMLWIQRTGESKHVMELQMVYRFSEEAQKLEKERGRGSSFNLSGHGESMKSTRATAAFHGLLHRQDQRRIMTTINPVGTLSFASGNLTMNYGEDYGWLHYTIINIGTPNVSFLVALDTGSDLLWVPCECRQCASKIANNQPLDLPLNMYHPAASKTSQRITCTDDLCESSEICQDKNDDCLYNVRYVSPNTWTSGVLVEDIIYLSSGRDLDGSVGTRIVFGCGQVQSGNFLSNGAPDGLLGLGMGTIAFPYRLAKAGLIKNSFSMCFASDGSGRIFFGDKGLASQKTTPFLPLNGTHLRYVVGLQSVVVGSSDIQQRTTIIIDSGTSFTYLPKDLYSAVTIEFDKQVTTNRVTLADVPWKFCYESSDGDMQTPPLSMVFIGGEIFPVYNPLIGIYNANGSIEAVCLAILESDIAIFGQSFMTGYQLVFDREDMQLGWAPTDCYRLHEIVNGNATTPAAPPVTDAPNGSPSPAPKPPASEPRYSNSGAAGHCLLYGHMYRDLLLLYFCIWILLQFLIGM